MNSENLQANPWSAAAETAQSAPAADAWLDAASTPDAGNWLDAAASAPPPEPTFDWLHPFRDAVLPVDRWVDSGLDWVVAHARPAFQAVRLPIDSALTQVEHTLLALPSLLVVLAFGLFAWQLGGRRLGLGAVLSMTVIGLIGAWDDAMVTLALVLTSVLFCLVIGLPVGVLMSRSERLEGVLRPFLDAMQTTPAFVYLVPVVMLFGIGNVPGVMVTVVFALPPLIRLTNLGIRQVRADLIEAGHAFGASPLQMLFKVQLPLAMPTIMAGINQTLMLALSMVVIASMIAVGGLGQMVLRGIGRLDMGLATIGGVGIVVLAIMLDRITQAMARSGRQRGHWYRQGPVGLVLALCRRAA